MYDVRAALEKRAVRLAQPRLEAVEFDIATKAIEEGGSQVTNDDPGANERFLVVDRDFHTLLIRKAGTAVCPR